MSLFVCHCHLCVLLFIQQCAQLMSIRQKGSRNGKKYSHGQLLHEIVGNVFIQPNTVAFRDRKKVEILMKGHTEISPCVQVKFLTFFLNKHFFL